MIYLVLSLALGALLLAGYAHWRLSRLSVALAKLDAELDVVIRIVRALPGAEPIIERHIAESLSALAIIDKARENLRKSFRERFPF